MSELRNPADRPTPEDGADTSFSAMTEEDIKTGTMNVVEVTSLVNLFNTMLLAMEGRLSSKIEAAARAVDDRWRLHDQDSDRNRASVMSRFEKLENSMLTIETALEAHLDKEHDARIATEARIKPVRTIVEWLWDHWRDLVLLMIGVLAVGTFLLDWLTHLFEIEQLLP